jgi:class 3 adenylate cyclase
MAVDDIERRLAAILAADVADYSRLTGADEEGTMQRLRELRIELIDPAVEAHRGRIVKTMGDGFLVEFASVVDAARAALDIQDALRPRNATLKPEERIEFRIGIHLGDVMVQPDGDLLGDSVNIAARLETIAARGGICLSEDAYRQVRDRLQEEFVDLGEKRFKNIARPMRVYAVRTGAPRGAATPESSDKGRSQAARRGHPGAAETGPMRLKTPVRVRAPGERSRIETVEQAINLIDRLPHEVASLPRWTFARALMVEAMRTGKSRDLSAAVRQLTQALSNERWLDQDETAGR